MATDALRLLFELDVDHRSGTAALLRFRKEIADTIAAARRAVTQPLKSLTTSPLTAPKPPRGSPQVDQHVRDFRRIEAEQKKSNQIQERERRRLDRAVESLQRQRSAAILRAFREEERAAIASARAQERAAKQAARAVVNAFRGIGPGLQSIGRTLTVGITAPLLALGVASLKSAKDIDANVNTLKAFTGSAEAAERRLAELIKTAQKSPGLTTDLALTLDAQLRTAQVTEEAINRVLPAIGRLNAVSRLQDPARFTQNLVQLITQNFERQDLKELVGQSPIAGQLIAEAFNVDSPTNAKAIRAAAQKLGIDSVEELFTAIAQAAERNEGLRSVTESIGTRFDKIAGRVKVALRPLGLAILNAIEPFVEPVARLVERIGKAFDSLSKPVKTAIIVIAGIAAALGPVLFVLGNLVSGITEVVFAVGSIGAVVAAIGLPEIALVIAGLLVTIGEWIVILGALGLAWKKNFLGIRDLVSSAGTAVLNAFNRIRAVIEETTQRILPTLQSVTEKVLGVVTALWERFGPTVVAIVGTSFAIVVRIIETTLRFLGNLADLALKIIDGDWRGAWRAFSRIVINALDSITEFFEKALPALRRGFPTLNAFIIRQAVTFAQTASTLAARFILAMVAAFIAGAPQISDALSKMLILAVAGVAVGPIGAALVSGLLESMRKAANEAPPIPIKVQAKDVGIDVGFTGGIARKKKTKTTDEDAEKGADAATRRRIRLIELEAERIRTLTDAQLAREQIQFDERKKSLEDWTNFQIEKAGDVLHAQLAVYARERVEAQKIRDKAARDLSLAEIGQKEFEAQQAFTTKVAQLEATRRKEELDAAKAHRQALLDIQETADAAEIARLEDLQRRGSVTAFDVATRQAEIEKAARARRRTELEKQKEEAGENLQERERVIDELKKFDEESAKSTQEGERRKREALQETVEAYNAYARAIIEAQARVAELTRETSIIQLESLRRRVGDRRRVLREQLRIEQEDARDRHEDNLRRIDDDENAAIEAAKKAGDIERRRLEIEKHFNDLRLAEDKRFNAERQANQEALERALDPLGPLKDRWDQFREAVQHANDAIADSVQSVAARITDSFDSMVDSLRQGIVAWILYGESLGKALKRALAEQLANLAAEFAIQAIKHAAYALGSLAFGDLAGAAKHAAAAAAFTAAAAATGFAARGLAKSAGLLKGNTATASGAVAGGEPSPRNAQFNLGGQGPVETSLRAAQEGSGGGILGRLVARMESTQQQTLDMQRQLMLVQGQTAQALNRIQSMRHGDALAIGAAENPAAVGRAVINNSNSDGEFNERLQRNLGLT